MEYLSREEMIWINDFRRESDKNIKNITNALAYEFENIILEKEMILDASNSLNIIKNYAYTAKNLIVEYLTVIKEYYANFQKENYDMWIIVNYRDNISGSVYADIVFNEEIILPIYKRFIEQFASGIQKNIHLNDTMNFLSSTIQNSTFLFLEIMDALFVDNSHFAIEQYLTDNFPEIGKSFFEKIENNLYVAENDIPIIRNKNILYYLMLTRVGYTLNNQLLSGEEFDSSFIKNSFEIVKSTLSEQIDKYKTSNPNLSKPMLDLLNMISITFNKIYTISPANLDAMYNFVSKLLLTTRTPR